MSVARMLRGSLFHYRISSHLNNGEFHPSGLHCRALTDPLWIRKERRWNIKRRVELSEIHSPGMQQLLQMRRGGL